MLACGLSLTKRGIADSFCVVTGKKADSDEPLTIPTYDPRQTIVILMGVRNFASIRKSMSEQGYPMDIPLCFISRAGRKDASYIHTNLGSANKKVDALKDAAPTIILVGHIAQDLETEIDYFSPESMGNSPRLWTEPDKTGIKVSSPT